MVDTGRPGDQVIAAMQAQNVFIGRIWPVWPNAVRITVGSAADMARFYASDVLYKGYTLPSIAGALHAAGITVGGPDGEQLDAGQFLPDVQWVTGIAGLGVTCTHLHLELVAGYACV